MTEEKVPVGRLAFRDEGLMWVAYFADENSRQIIGSIRMSVVVTNPQLKQRFMDTMIEAVSCVVETIIGERPTWTEPRAAPGHERRRKT